MQEGIIIKFCVVGEPAVGKTSMLIRYIHEKFDEKVKPTIGCDFQTKLKSNKNGGKQIRLQIWDIAGQQRFNAVSKMYLRGALGCIIVCSSTEKSTIDETLKWKRMIEQNSDFGNETNIPCLLVQNKSDLIDAENPEQFQKKSYMQQFAKTHGFCSFVHTSAKQNKNISEIFQVLLDETFSRGLIKSKEANKGKSVKEENTIKLSNQGGKKEDIKKKKTCC